MTSKGILTESNLGSAPLGKNFLFVIGIDEYVHSPKLNNAVSDAKAVKKLLCENYQFEEENVFELYNADATKRNIVTHFRSFIDRVEQGKDNLVTYFSGHGHYDKKIGRGYWVPVDAQFEPDVDYIENSFVTDIVKSIKTLHTLLIVDSCFSGVPLVRDMGVATERLERDPSRWMLASGRNEVVSDGEVGDNSPFAKELIDVLQQHSTKPIRISELVNKVTTRVGNDVDQIPIGRPLHGVGDKGGEFVFHPKHNEQYAWPLALKNNSVDSFNQFIKRYPNSVHQDEAHWRIVSIRNIVSSYDDYCIEFPDGAFVTQAKEAMFSLGDKKAYDKATKQDIIFSYREYVDQFPSGNYCRQAKERIEHLKREERKAQAIVTGAPTKQEDSEIPKKPLKQPAHQAANQEDESGQKVPKLVTNDEADWNNATSQNRIKWYDEYLSKHPKGRYRKEAKANIKMIRGKRAQKKSKKSLSEHPQGKYADLASMKPLQQSIGERPQSYPPLPVSNGIKFIGLIFISTILIPVIQFIALLIAGAITKVEVPTPIYLAIIAVGGLIAGYVARLIVDHETRWPHVIITIIYSVVAVWINPWFSQFFQSVDQSYIMGVDYAKSLGVGLSYVAFVFPLWLGSLTRS